MSFATLFIVLLVAKVAVLVWLSMRQTRAVSNYSAKAPTEFADVIGADDIAKTAGYTAARQNLGRIALLISLAMTLIWTIGGGLVWLDSQVLALLGLAPGGLVHGLATIGAFSLVGAIAGLPLSIYSTFVVEQRFGFNRTTARLFAADLVKSFFLAIALGGAVLAVILWLMESMRGTMWWLWAWGFLVVWNLILVAVYPRWLAPLFNRFSPLPEGDLRTRIQALLERCGFNASSVFVMDGSKRSAHGNAYFTGFGRNKRVVFFDTLLDTLSADETEAVLAHELGHSALGHIPKTLVITIALWLPALWLLDYLLGAPWFFAAFGLAPADHSALLLLMLVLPPFIFPLQPMMNFLSRKHEFEADAYAARHSDRQSLISALVQLYKDNSTALTPDPWYSLWHDSHPPPLLRIARLKSLPAA